MTTTWNDAVKTAGLHCWQHENELPKVIANSWLVQLSRSQPFVLQWACLNHNLYNSHEHIHTVSNSQAKSLHRTYDGPISTTTFTFGRSAGRRARNCSSFLASTCHASAGRREKRGYGINSTRVTPASGRTCSSSCKKPRNS